MTGIAAFFVTPSDSGSLVIDMLASGGNPDPPAYQKLRFAFPIAPLRDAEGKTYRAEVHLRDRALLHDVTNANREEMIEYFLRYYARHLTWDG